MSEPKRIVAAFQGGGAKGIAYVGAVRALEQRGYTFKAVAGTSAGSIVAALLAAGFESHELVALVPQILSRVAVVKEPRFAAQRDPRQLGHYSLEGVRDLVETALRQKVRADDAANAVDVTFRELYDATGIELDILVTAAPGEPFLLSVWNAPDCQVSYAVVASSAIPFVMTPQLLAVGSVEATPQEIIDDVGPQRTWIDHLLRLNPIASKAFEADRAAQVASANLESTRVVVDGGAWANFPGLCFTDRSLRFYYNAPDLEGFPMVGFILDPTPDPADVPDAPSGKQLPTVKQRLVRGLARTALANAGLFTVLPSIFMYIGSLVLLVYQWFSLPDQPGLLSLGWRVLVTIGLLMIGAIGLGWGYLTRFIPVARLSLSTLIRGMTSISVGVPPWIGADPRSRIIRVPASSQLIGTVSFDPTADVVQKLVDRAAVHVGGDLDSLPIGKSHSGVRSDQPGSVRFVDLRRFDVKAANNGIGDALEQMGTR